MRPPIHFDGQPDRFSRVLALMPKTLTADVRYAKPKASKFRLPLRSVNQWFAKWGRKAS